jgi:hypothetical protein
VNSSTANINSSASFTGIGESTLGVDGIQVSFIADQPVTIQVQQSMDNSNWDIVDSYTLDAGTGSGRTFQAVASYFRIIITNNGLATTTYLRLQVALCPVVEAVPRALSLAGRLKVEPANTSCYPFQLLYNTTATLTKSVLYQTNTYTVPSKWDLKAATLQGNSATATTDMKASQKVILGTYNSATNTFTDGTVLVVPRFCAQLYCIVTTLIGAVGNDVVTITYTNQAGVTGHTATATVNKNAAAGYCFEATLAAGDIGVCDVTNVTHSQAGQAGAYEIAGLNDIFYETLDTAAVNYTSPSPNETHGTILAGENIALFVIDSSGNATLRRISFLGALVSRY